MCFRPYTFTSSQPSSAVPRSSEALRSGPATNTKRLQVRFLVATDGEIFETEGHTTDQGFSSDKCDNERHRQKNSGATLYRESV